MVAIGATIQVLVAITIVIILFVIGFSIFNGELVNAMQNAGKLKRFTKIFSGVKDFKYIQGDGDIFDTTDKRSSTYVDLSPAYNQKGGIEYSYNFWLYIDRAKIGGADAAPPVTSTPKQTDSGLSPTDKILFLRGNNKPISYKSICNRNKTDILTKSPLVKFEKSNLDILTVEFNTVDSPDAVNDASRNKCLDQSNDDEFMNTHKISLKDFSKESLEKKWFMVSVVLQDTNPSDPLPLRNNVRTQIFVNGVLELDQYAKGRLADSPSLKNSVLRVNSGNLYLYPEITTSTGAKTNDKSASVDQGFLMADLTYYNYALIKDEIKNIFNSGFNKNIAPSINSISSMNSYTLNNIWDNKSAIPSSKQLRVIGV